MLSVDTAAETWPSRPEAAPSWECGEAGLAHSLRRGGRAVLRLLERWVLCRGSRVEYLRRCGARIGRHTAILNEVAEFGTEPWLIEIGSRVTVASGVLLLTHDGASRVFRHRIAGGSSFGNRFGTIRIRDGSFIGARSILLPGVTVGPDSIVGAGSVVTCDVPPRTVVAGQPARRIADLEEYIDRYRAKMLPGLPSSRRELRRELTVRLWGEER